MALYNITNIDQFVEASRVLVYHNFGKQGDMVDTSIMVVADLSHEEQIEIDRVLNQTEAMSMSKDFLTESGDEDNQYKISEKNYLRFLDSLTGRLVSNMLNKMVSQGLLESAFDDEANDFVFWVKDEETKEKPETD